MRRRTLLACLAGGVAAPVAAATVPALAVTGTVGGVVRGNRASRLTTLPAATEQVVVVHGPGGAATTALLEAFAKVHGGWRPVADPVPARIGAHGFSDNHREGDGTTPTGVYGFGATMYGIAANPGVRYPYHRLVTGDWWNENPTSAGYNSFQHSAASPGGGSEALWRTSPQYTHFAVITYNMPPTVAKPVPYRGSGIFLHQSGAGATAGCVSVPHASLVAVLTWLDPARSPRIVLSPTADLHRY